MIWVKLSKVHRQIGSVCRICREPGRSSRLMDVRIWSDGSKTRWPDAKIVDKFLGLNVIGDAWMICWPCLASANRWRDAVGHPYRAPRPVDKSWWPILNRVNNSDSMIELSITWAIASRLHREASGQVRN